MIQPEGKKLIVLPIPAEEGSVNGIVIPESVNMANLSYATVVEVSPDLSTKYKKGDKVLHPSKSGLGQLYKGAFHLWLREDQGEIWGVELPDTGK